MENSVEQATTKATYMLAGSATIFGFSVNEFIGLCGLVLGLLSFFVNIWFKREMLKIERQRSEKSNELH